MTLKFGIMTAVQGHSGQDVLLCDPLAFIVLSCLFLSFKVSALDFKHLVGNGVKNNRASCNK